MTQQSPAVQRALRNGCPAQGRSQASLFGMIVSLMFITGAAFGQLSLDSLTKALEKESNDSIRLQLLLALSTESEFSDYAKSRNYANEASVLADRLGNWARGRAYLRQAFLETMEGDYADALRYDLRCAALYAQEKDSSNLAKAYTDIGADFRDLGEYDDAYVYLMRSYLIAKTFRSGRGRIDSLTMLVALHNLGTLFRELGQYDIAYKHLMASSVLSEAIDDADGPAYTYDELGELYRKQDNYIKAEENLLMAASEARRRKIRFLLPRIKIHLANLYLDKGDFQKSLTYFDSIRIGQLSSTNKFLLAQCDLGTGRVQAKIGKYDEALEHFQNSLKTSKELNARNLTLSGYEALASLYEIRKEYAKSLQFHKLHDALRDSIFSKSTQEKILQDQIRLQTMTKDVEIAALSQLQEQQTSEIKRQELVQNVLVVVSVLAIILLYTVYRSGQRRKRINKMLLDHQEEIKKRSMELHQLNQVKDKFFSIISHDLRSPMSALAGTLDLLHKKGITPEEFASLTQALRLQFNHTKTLINNLLDWTLLQMDKLKIQPETVNLFDVVEESVEVLQNLYPKNIQFENHIDQHLQGFADPNILSLVLRNLILNAIKFTETGGRVWVTATTSNEEIVVSVCDNGTGIKQEIQEFLFTKTSSYSTRGTANEKGTGLGLILCKEFIERNGGRIWLESEPGKGSSFHFTLPTAKSGTLASTLKSVAAH